VEAEIVNHSLMRHPHVVQFREVFLTSKFICIAMEYAGAGSLHAYVKQQGHLKEAVARWFFQQLAVAVDYCHKRGVANRDIKLENTLLAVRVVWGPIKVVATCSCQPASQCHAWLQLSVLLPALLPADMPRLPLLPHASRCRGCRCRCSRSVTLATASRRTSQQQRAR
jgi:hypothetical protein